jgi:hypothetical protein
MPMSVNPVDKYVAGGEPDAIVRRSARKPLRVGAAHTARRADAFRVCGPPDDTTSAYERAYAMRQWRWVARDY